jgi:hypothetical protein
MSQFPLWGCFTFSRLVAFTVSIHFVLFYFSPFSPLFRFPFVFLPFPFVVYFIQLYQIILLLFSPCGLGCSENIIFLFTFLCLYLHLSYFINSILNFLLSFILHFTPLFLLHILYSTQKIYSQISAKQ